MDTLRGSQEKRNWFVNSRGQTFATIVGPAEFSMGSPHSEPSRESDEPSHRRRILRSFAACTKEITVREFFEFRSLWYTYNLSPSPDCPANNVTLFDAAAYCRWLSEKEQVADDQMCFPPLSEIKSGMHLPENYLQRTGYRLPTEGEWEYMCRAGSDTSHFFGGAIDLLPQYSIHAENSTLTRNGRATSHPAGRLKPNPWGLFDICGNVSDVTHSRSSLADHSHAPEPAAVSATHGQSSPPAR